MKPAPFIYHDPATLDEALGLLARCENARPLAGGQSLVPMLNFRFVLPDHVIDLNQIAGLADVRVEPDRIVFGAMTRQRTLEQSAEIATACPILTAALAHVGHRQTRNRGTIGGSLCHLDPSAELVNLACLHDAQLAAHSSRGPHNLAFTEFALGYLSNGLADDELLTSIAFPRWPAAHGFGFEEVARRRGDFAIAAASTLIELDDADRIRRAALCVSGVGPLPARLPAVEAMLTGEQGSAELYRAAAIEAEKLDAMDDAYVGAKYRTHLARVLVYRALERGVADARERRNAHA
jgi:carbon-monoxide dehydrogenase medium subunit